MQKENTEARTENNAGGTRMNGTGVWILYCLISAVAELILIGCKIAGSVTWSWPAVLLSYFWISIAVMAAFVLLALVIITARDLHRWNRTRRVMNRIRKDFNLLARGEVLDKIAVKYGLSRAPDETDKELRERILQFVKKPYKPKGGTANGL